MLGCRLAGVALGSFTPGFLADTHLAPQLAGIGVIPAAMGMNFILAGGLLPITLNPLLSAAIEPLRVALQGRVRLPDPASRP